MLPKNWNDITIEQYVEFYKTLKEQPETDDGIYNLVLKRICILTDLEYEYIDENLTMKEINEMATLQKTELPQKLILDFRFNGRRYKANIDPTTYKGGRFMACLNTLSDEDKRLDRMHQTIFNVCNQVDWKGKPVDLTDDELIKHMEEFKQLPLKVANPLYVFFCSLSEYLSDVIVKYSTQQMEKAQKKIQEELAYLESSDI